jgi:hypothetical protein
MRAQRGSNKGGIFAVFLIAGLYFLNLGTGFMKLPVSFDKINQIVFVVGGALLIIGGFKFLSSKKYMPGY